jgi:uncharacterized protein GlcG (DUF336 family)
MLKNLLKMSLAALIAAPLTVFTLPAQAEDDEATVSFKVMTPEVAVELAQAALEACRDMDYQVAVAVVDRFGILQTVVRDRYAGPHTPETARRKAWTSVSFRSDTLSLVKSTQAGAEASGIRFVADALMAGGGVPVTAAGTLVGGVGISGAPSGEADHKCAEMGIEAVSDKLDF